MSQPHATPHGHGSFDANVTRTAAGIGWQPAQPQPSMAALPVDTSKTEPKPAFYKLQFGDDLTGFSYYVLTLAVMIGRNCERAAPVPPPAITTPSLPQIPPLDPNQPSPPLSLPLEHSHNPPQPQILDTPPIPSPSDQHDAFPPPMSPSAFSALVPEMTAGVDWSIHYDNPHDFDLKEEDVSALAELAEAVQFDQGIFDNANLLSEDINPTRVGLEPQSNPLGEIETPQVKAELTDPTPPPPPPPPTKSSAPIEHVDVDLGPLKSVSRNHAKIEYKPDLGHFCLEIYGRNGAWVDDRYYVKGSVVPLAQGSQIQIATRIFSFILPPSPFSSPTYAHYALDGNNADGSRSVEDLPYPYNLPANQVGYQEFYGEGGPGPTSAASMAARAPPAFNAFAAADGFGLGIEGIGAHDWDDEDSDDSSDDEDDDDEWADSYDEDEDDDDEEEEGEDAREHEEEPKEIDKTTSKSKVSSAENESDLSSASSEYGKDGSAKKSTKKTKKSVQATKSKQQAIAPAPSSTIVSRRESVADSVKDEPGVDPAGKSSAKGSKAKTGQASLKTTKSKKKGEDVDGAGGVSDQTQQPSTTTTDGNTVTPTKSKSKSKKAKTADEDVKPKVSKKEKKVKAETQNQTIPSTTPATITPAQIPPPVPTLAAALASTPAPTPTPPPNQIRPPAAIPPQQTVVRPPPPVGTPGPAPPPTAQTPNGNHPVMVSRPPMQPGVVVRPPPHPQAVARPYPPQQHPGPLVRPPLPPGAANVPNNMQDRQTPPSSAISSPQPMLPFYCTELNETPGRPGHIIVNVPIPPSGAGPRPPPGPILGLDGKPFIGPPPLKPTSTFAVIIHRALQFLPRGRGTLGEVCNWVAGEWEWFRLNVDSGWQNSIRHNLSLNKAFLKVSRIPEDDPESKGSVWVIDPEEGPLFEEKQRKDAAKSANNKNIDSRREKERIRAEERAKKQREAAMEAARHPQPQMQRAMAPRPIPRPVPQQAPAAPPAPPAPVSANVNGVLQPKAKIIVVMQPITPAMRAKSVISTTDANGNPLPFVCDGTTLVLDQQTFGHLTSDILDKLTLLGAAGAVDVLSAWVINKNKQQATKAAQAKTAATSSSSAAALTAKTGVTGVHARTINGLPARVAHPPSKPPIAAVTPVNKPVTTITAAAAPPQPTATAPTPAPKAVNASAPSSGVAKPLPGPAPPGTSLTKVIGMIAAVANAKGDVNTVGPNASALLRYIRVVGVDIDLRVAERIWATGVVPPLPSKKGGIVKSPVPPATGIKPAPQVTNQRPASTTTTAGVKRKLESDPSTTPTPVTPVSAPAVTSAIPGAVANSTAVRPPAPVPTPTPANTGAGAGVEQDAKKPRLETSV